MSIQSVDAMRFLSGNPVGQASVFLQASDGLTYVVNFFNQQQNCNAAFNEAAGIELYRACSLPAPLWKPLEVTIEFIRANERPFANRETSLALTPGVYFGYTIPKRDDSRLLAILPQPYFSRIGNRLQFWHAWIVDVCARQTRPRNAIFIEERGSIRAMFVDNAGMFGGQTGNDRGLFRGTRYLDERIYELEHQQSGTKIIDGLRAPDVDAIWQRVESLPEEWKTKSGMSKLSDCLDRLLSQIILEEIIDIVYDKCATFPSYFSGLIPGVVPTAAPLVQ